MPARALSLLLLVLAGIPASAASQRPLLAPVDVKLDALIRETQQSTISSDNVELVWWIPKEYWSATFARQAKLDVQTRETIQKLFGRYTVVAAVHARMGEQGLDQFMTDAEMGRQLRIIDAGGNETAPIPRDQQDSLLSLILAEVKPILSNSMGPMGANMNFYVFPGSDKDGKALADAASDGRLTIALGDARYTVRLPLDSLLVPVTDAKSGEQFPGSYRFNPYTGDALLPPQTDHRP